MTNSDIFNRMISPSLVGVEFRHINNTYNTRLDGKDLMIGEISVKSLGPTGGLVRFNETADKSADKSGWKWHFYCRSETGRVEMGLNEIRQRIASQET